MSLQETESLAGFSDQCQHDVSRKCSRMWCCRLFQPQHHRCTDESEKRITSKIDFPGTTCAVLIPSLCRQSCHWWDGSANSHQLPPVGQTVKDPHPPLCVFFVLFCFTHQFHGFHQTQPHSEISNNTSKQQTTTLLVGNTCDDFTYCKYRGRGGGGYRHSHVEINCLH